MLELEGLNSLVSRQIRIYEHFDAHVSSTVETRPRGLPVSSVLDGGRTDGADVDRQLLDDAVDVRRVHTLLQH